jgi:DNA-binding transcriptional MerR regulator
MTDNGAKLVTVNAAARLLGVTPLTLRNWDKSGKFPASRHPINNYRVYRMSDIDKLLTEIDMSKGKGSTKSKTKKLVVSHLS